MIGVEIVDNKDSKKPAPNAATHIKETMVARHVLLAVDGPHVNVVKIKPPMVFAEAEADHLIAELTQVPILAFLHVLPAVLLYSAIRGPCSNQCSLDTSQLTKAGRGRWVCRCRPRVCE